jgi:molybdate transport system ATP-binding protein
MTIEVDITHRLGAFRLDARFAARGGLVGLFGPSGSGKTSIVNVIAGLTLPDRGSVTVDGITLLDTERGICVPRHRRRLGYVFQEARLFPHLTVRHNLLYGRWFTRAKERREDLGRVVDLLGLGHLLERRPGRLSGGEKQRVAIGRALLASPRLLLMDEPLASLDEARKAEILPYIEKLRDEAKVPIVYVSHAIAEVARLATSVVLLSEGKIAAVGATGEVLNRLDVFSFDEVSTLIEARVERQDRQFELTELRSAAGLWRLTRIEAPIGARVRLRVRARDVVLANGEPTGISALNIFPAVVAEIGDACGPSLQLRLDCNGEVLIASLTRFSMERLGLAPGLPVHAVVKSVSIDRLGLGPGA